MNFLFVRSGVCRILFREFDAFPFGSLAQNYTLSLKRPKEKRHNKRHIEGHTPNDDHHLWHPARRLFRRHPKPSHHERSVRGVRIKNRKNENIGNGKKMCVNQPYLSEKNDIWLVCAQKMNNSWTGMLEYRSHSHGHYQGHRARRI